MIRNTENVRFCYNYLNNEYSPVDSMIFVDLWISFNFDVSDEKLGIDFFLPNSAYKICYLY